MMLKRWTKAAGGVLCCALSAASARATSMNGLASSNSVSATDTIAVCQVAAGCGTSNPLHQVPISAVLGTVASTITGATTLGNNANNVVTPVSGTGYAVTLPQSTSSTLPAGSKVILVAAPGASVHVCVANGSTFDAHSGAAISSGICTGGTSGIALSSGEAIDITSESGGNYYAVMLGEGGGSGLMQAAKTGNYTVAYTGSSSVTGTDASTTLPVNCTGCVITLPAITGGVFPTGTWIRIVDTGSFESTGNPNLLIAPTSPSTIYGAPLTIGTETTAGQTFLSPGQTAFAQSDGTNWLVTIGGSLPGIAVRTNTSYSAEGWDCVQIEHFTASTTVSYVVPAGLPNGCTLNIVQDGAGQVQITAGAGLTLNANVAGATYTSGYSAGQYANFFVTIENSGTAAILGGNIVAP